MIRRHSASVHAAAIAVVIAVLGLVLANSGGPLASTGASATTSQAAGQASGAVTKTETVRRTFVQQDKTKKVVAANHVSLTVDQTKDLKSLQLIHVSWSGAHPTGGLVADQNSDLAQNEEYPFVLMECRGTRATVTPETCWTQFADERFNYGGNPLPAWQSDLYATAAERQDVVNSPGTAKLAKTTCPPLLWGTAFQHWLPFKGADGTTYPGGPFDCAGSAPEASPANYSSLSLPSNETFGVTDTNGKGSADFDVFTGEDHTSLGCSQTVACSLVAIPIEGLSCDPAGTAQKKAHHPTGDDLDTATKNCESTGNFQAGQGLPSQASGAPAVDGTLWWSASNWRNRMVVPLQFAPPDNACGLDGGGHPISVYGSELLTQATTSWSPHFCLDSKLFDFSHVQTPEPQARNVLANGSIEAAFGSDPPDTPYATPTANAPTAVTGFGIAFDVDNADGQRVTSLNLDPRLLAKLLTESYPSEPFVKSSYDALSNNPMNITDDPEFQALNPGIPTSNAEAAATLLAVNTQSDVMYALTSYINADPEARAWLNGAPDPWGMVVNPNYKGIQLPVNNWPLRDTFEPTDEYQPGRNDCLYADPAPYLPLVAAPTSRLYNIGLDMQFALAQSQTTCVLPSPIPGQLQGAKLVANGRQPSGHHFMLGIVSLGDAAREGRSLANLETQTSPSAPTKFTDTTGRTFVGPTDAGLQAATAMLSEKSSTGMWPISYRAMRDDPQGAKAYPGTMIVYAQVPLTGLPTEDAKDYAILLRYIAGPGQQPGTAQGELPAGYLPMTSANGLGAMVSYTDKAATAIAAQQGTINPTSTSTGSSTPPPSPVTTSHAAPPPNTHTRSSAPTAGPPPPPPAGQASAPPAGGYTAPADGGSTPSDTTAPSAAPSSSASPSTGSSGPPTPSSSTSLVADPTPGTSAGVGGWILPALLGLALAALIGSVISKIAFRQDGRG